MTLASILSTAVFLSGICRLEALDLEPALGTRHINMAWNAQHVVVSGHHVFMVHRDMGAFETTVGPTSVQVLDASDPTYPQWISSLDPGGDVNDLVIVGNYACLASGDAGLRVIDISDPAKPEQMGVTDAGGNALVVAVVGNYAYVGLEGGRLQVMDVSNPGDPQLVGGYGRVNIPVFVRGIAVSGDYAYLALGDSGLEVIDVSNRSDPRRIGTRLIGQVSRVVVEEDRAYLIGGDGLVVMDVSDPSSPRRIVQYPGIHGDLAVMGDHAYVASRDGGVEIIDIADPRSLALVGNYPGNAQHLAVSGNHAYVGTGFPSALAVLDVSDPAQPELLGGYAAVVNPRDMVLTGDYACVADGSAGLVIFDLSDPQHPDEIGSLFLGAPAESLAVMGDHALVAADNTLHVIDIRNPARPSRVARFLGEGTVVGVAVSGQYTYLAEQPRWNGTTDVGGGLRVIDISDLADPHEVGGFGNGRYASSVAVAGDYAFLADGGNFESGVKGEGLVILDISNPENPRPIGNYETAGYIQGVALSGNHVFLTVRARYDGTETLRGGLEVIDISDPKNPMPVGRYESRDYGYSEEIYISGRYVFTIGWEDVGVGNGGSNVPGPLHIFDVSDPTRPEKIGTYWGTAEPSRISSSVRALAIEGNSVWVAEALLEAVLHGHLHRGGALQELVPSPANPQR